MRLEAVRKNGIAPTFSAEDLARVRFEPPWGLELIEAGRYRAESAGIFSALLSIGGIELSAELEVRCPGSLQEVETHDGRVLVDATWASGNIHRVSGDLVLEGVRQMRGASTSQVDGATSCLVTSGEGVPTSALVLRR